MPSIVFKIPPRYGKRRGSPNRCKAVNAKRDEVLFRLGFASYQDYLRSPLWAGIRTAKLEATPRCECCGDKAQQVHHMTYTRSVLDGKRPHQLVCVCESCHVKIEFAEDGSKRSFEAGMKKAKRMLKKAGNWEAHGRQRDQ